MPAIVLATINARYIHASLGLRWLKANLAGLAAETQILEFTLEDRAADMAEAILAAGPRIVGLGVYIWNARQSRELVVLLKQVAPELVVVLGGPEVSHEPFRVDFGAADYIVQGEGELAFAALSRDVLAGRKRAERIIAARGPEPAALALPYDLYTDTDIAHRVLYIEASRGCPFGCEFCLSSLDRRLRFFKTATMLAELEKLWRRGARTFKFVDRSFNCSAHMALAILDFFLDKTPPFHAHFEVVPDHFPAAIRERLRRFPAGCLQLEIGIQTLKAGVAAAIGRRLDMEKIRENLRFLTQETAAHLHLDLIMGLPGESALDFGDNLDQLMLWSAGQAEIQLGILKKLSGTAITRHDERFGMVYSPEPPYELLQNHQIPFAAMQELGRMARFWDLVVNSGNFRRTAPLLWQDGRVFTGFSAFARWLFAETRATWKIALPRLAELLFQYLVRERACEPARCANLLAADILTVKGRVLPAAIQAHVTLVPVLHHRPARPLAKRQHRRQAY